MSVSSKSGSAVGSKTAGLRRRALTESRVDCARGCGEAWRERANEARRVVPRCQAAMAGDSKPYDDSSNKRGVARRVNRVSDCIWSARGWSGGGQHVKCDRD
eukprot:6202153-Pleurochrysis_carterae.AAC.3